jgi:hypothetical protein
MLNGDQATFLAGFAPDVEAQMEKNLNERGGPKAINPDEGTEFRILDRQAVSDDEMVLTLYVGGKNANGHSEKTVFVKIDGAWKITEKPPPSNLP